MGSTPRPVDGARAARIAGSGQVYVLIVSHGLAVTDDRLAAAYEAWVSAILSGAEEWISVYLRAAA